MRMVGTLRGVFTVAGAGVAGLLVWITTQIGQGTTGGYWAVYGLFAAAGLTIALSQLFGGWTKWGWPGISVGVLLVGFLPVLVVVGWVLLAGQPEANWFQRHVTAWSGDIGILGAVNDLRLHPGVLAFGLGLVFGLTFDTAPRAARAEEETAAATAEAEARLDLTHPEEPISPPAEEAPEPVPEASRARETVPADPSGEA